MEEVKHIFNCACTTKLLLNLDDHQLKIAVRQLNVAQQYMITLVDERIADVVNAVWSASLNPFYFSNHVLNDIEVKFYVEFVKALAPHLTEMIVRGFSLPYWRVLDYIVFDRVHSLDFEFSTEDTWARNIPFGESDLCSVVDMFCNLRTLKLSKCSITGHHLTKFAHLQHLALHNVNNLNMDHLITVFEKCNLRKFDYRYNWSLTDCAFEAMTRSCSLEYIKLNCIVLAVPKRLESLLKMSRLVKLTLFTLHNGDGLLQSIVPNNIRRIKGFKYIGEINEKLFFSRLTHLIDLQTMTIVHQPFVPLVLTAAQLYCIARSMQSLQELHLIDCYFESQEECEDGLLSFVYWCPELRLLNLTNCRNIKNSFVRRCARVVQGQSQRREPLYLWAKGTDITMDVMLDPSYVYNLDKLIIDMRKTRRIVDPPGMMKFKFYPEDLHHSSESDTELPAKEFEKIAV